MQMIDIILQFFLGILPIWIYSYITTDYGSHLYNSQLNIGIPFHVLVNALFTYAARLDFYHISTA